MGFLKRVNGLVLGLAVLLAVGCGRDNNNDPEPENINDQRECLLTNVFSPGASNTPRYHYDEQRRIIRIGDTTGRRDLYNYDVTGLIITIKYYQYILQDTSLTSYMVHEYLPNGLLKKAIDYRRANATAPIVEVGSVTQEFNAANQQTKRSYYTANNKVWPYHFALYTHLPNWTIKEEHYKNDNNVPVLDYTSYWTFDNKKQPFTISDFHKDGWGYGNLVLNTDIDKYNDTTVYSYTYQYNAKDFPIEKSAFFNGTFQYKFLYDYNCQ